MASVPTILHHRVLPSSSSNTGYFPNQTVDFVIQAPSRKLVSGSLRIEATVAVSRLSDGGPQQITSECKLDAFVGAHSFFDQFSTEVESKGMMETLQNYPRYMSMQSKASMSQDDTCTLAMGAELRSGGKSENGKYALQPVIERSDDATGAGNKDTDPSSFSIKPMVCFNRSQGNQYSFDRNGFIRVSCILARNSDAFFGRALDGSNCSYVLSDLACRFVTVPEDNDVSPQLMRSYISTVNSVQSTASSLVSRVPSSRVNGVAVSFIKQADVQSADENSLALQSVPNYVSTEYNFASSTNQNVTYVLFDKADAIQRGLDALTDSGHSNVSIQTLKANNGSILGIPFGQYLDLSNQLFSMKLNLQSTTITSEPMQAMSFFSSLLEL